MKRIVLGLLVCSLGVAGCGDDEVEDRTPYERLAVTADTAEGYEEGGVPAPVTPVQGPEGPADVTVGGPLTATGELRGVAGNAPPGSVTVTEYGQGTRVQVAIHRYTEGTELQASIVAGSCELPGEVVRTIPDILTIGTGGVATLVTQVPIPTRTLLNGRHSIRVTNPGATPPAANTPEIVLACANLPAAG
jgi:hypothetical protein